MKLNLTVYELGKALKKIEEKYKVNILVKLSLSGGWMTIMGKASILKYPSDSNGGCSGKDNIIDINVKSENDKDGSIIKITGAKNKKFSIDISNTRYKELRPNNLTINQIKVNENESKLRIDENIIFTIKASVDEITKIIEN
jgi:hypothetical protein